MIKIDLQPGDVFLVRSKTILDPIINFFQRFWALDNESTYGHAGIILDEAGNTLEALWTVGSQCFYERNKGCQVLVARWANLRNHSPEWLLWALQKVMRHDGQWFPVHRLFLQMLFLAKFIHWESVVCSELVAQFLHEIGARHRYWFGTNVDALHDEFVNYRDYEVVFEGMLE